MRTSTITALAVLAGLATASNCTAAESLPAKVLFGKVTEPAPLAARSIGFYARGCMAGAVALPVNGPRWQAMRLSRNRNWGHPMLVALLERLAYDGAEKDG